MPVDRRVVMGSVLSLAVGAKAQAQTMFNLTHADGRCTHYRLIAPEAPGKWGVVLFSHGANSTNRSYDRLWRAFAARGYLVIGANHLDSGPRELQPKFTISELWRTRVADAALPILKKDPFDAFAKSRGASLDWTSVCAAGHSYGAVIAQALAGAALLDPGDHNPFDGRQPTVATCIAFSPPGPLKGFIPETAWSTVRVPSLLQTGDADVLPGFVNDWRDRLIGFSGSPDRWSIVAKGVDHYFGGLICRLKPDAGADLPALNETAQLAGQFLDAYIRHAPEASQALKIRAKQSDDGFLTFVAA